MSRQNHKRRPSPGKARRQQQRGRSALCPNCEAENLELRGRCWRCGAALGESK